MTVSIVTYRTDLDEMRKCLASLESDAVEKIWVIDNSSDEDMRDFCKGRPKTEYVPNPNVGFGTAHNIAIRRAIAVGSRRHLVLNSDVRFEPDVLPRLEAYMDANPDIAVLQPKVVYPDGSHQPTARLLPAPIDVFGRRFLPKSWMRKRNDRYTLAGISDSKDEEIPYLQGSFLLFDCNALKAKGQFDERFFMYPEDIDICRRMHEYGRVVRHPAETIIHDHRAGSYHSRRLLHIHVVNMIRYFNKWGWIFDRRRKDINARCLSNL